MASAKTDADAAMAAEDDSSLVSSLHTRLVSSGEWNKLLKHVRITLDGSQWEDDLREYTRGVCSYVVKHLAMKSGRQEDWLRSHRHRQGRRITGYHPIT